MFIWAQDSGKGFSVWNLLSMCLNPEGQYTDGVFLLEDGEPVLTVDEEKASDNRMQPDFKPLNTKMVSYKARLNFRQSNEAKELFGHDDSARAEGILYHNIMAEIRDASQIELTLRKSRMQGRLTQEQYDELKGLLQQIESDQMIAQWFAPENRVFAECDILNPKARRKNKRDQRPDRIIMNNGVITVIDYKFGDEHKDYKTQVKNYMNLLRKIYPQHEIKGYIWYVRNKNYTTI
jgi:ATP-dependent exoDNAse (exonuclease V) beta subunit